MQTVITIIQFLSGIFLVLGGIYVLILLWRFTVGSRTRRRRRGKDVATAWDTVKSFIYAIVFLSLGIGGYLNAIEIARMIPFLD